VDAVDLGGIAAGAGVGIVGPGILSRAVE